MAGCWLSLFQLFRGSWRYQNFDPEPGWPSPFKLFKPFGSPLAQSLPITFSDAWKDIERKARPSSYRAFGTAKILNPVFRQSPVSCLRIDQWSDVSIGYEVIPPISYTCILEKAQINANLRDFCFLSSFSPHERNCTTFGIFALCAFWSQNYERIFPGNKRKYPGKKRKYPSIKKQMRVF